jgi:hypothetical protein
MEAAMSEHILRSAFLDGDSGKEEAITEVSAEHRQHQPLRYR